MIAVWSDTEAFRPSPKALRQRACSLQVERPPGASNTNVRRTSTDRHPPGPGPAADAASCANDKKCMSRAVPGQAARWAEAGDRIDEHFWQSSQIRRSTFVFYGPCISKQLRWSFASTNPPIGEIDGMGIEEFPPSTKPNVMVGAALALALTAWRLRQPDSELPADHAGLELHGPSLSTPFRNLEGLMEIPRCSAGELRRNCCCWVKLRRVGEPLGRSKARPSRRW